MRKALTAIAAVLLFAATGYVLFHNYLADRFAAKPTAGGVAATAPAALPMGNPLVREIVRQAWLVAQRDGLGRSTRDPVLREPRLAGDEAVPDLAPTCYFDGDCLMATVPGSGSKGEWHSVIPRSEVHLDYRDEAKATEARSRDAFVAAIRSMGFDGAPVKVYAGPGTGPGDLGVAERRLQQMNFISQFAAVRLAHQSTRDAGMSPRALGVLVRGYANLGLLTRCLWNATSQTMAARSIIYAQRMMVAAPADEPAAQRRAYWHMGYALAMAGFQADGADDIEHARTLTGPERTPDWVAQLDAYCHYQTHKLTDLTATQTGDAAQLPAFLAYLTIEHTASPSALNQFGRAVLEGEPDNLRVIDAITEISGVAADHELTTYALVSMPQLSCGRIAELPGVPESVFRAVKRCEAAKYSPETFAAVARALVDAGKEDRGEPSWAMLGRMVQDANFLNVYRRVYFEARLWSIDPTASVDALYPLVADHPYGPAVRLLAMDRAPQAKRHAMVQEVRVVDPQIRMIRMLTELHGAGNDPIGEPTNVWGNLVFYYTDYTTPDAEDLFISEVQEHKDRAVKRLVNCFPQHPALVANRVATAWPAAEAEAVKLADADGGGSPLIVGALGRKYSELHDWPKAEHYLRQYLEVCQDAWAYERLANNYLAQGDEDKWLATMQESLQQPDYRLDHAQTNEKIARHFMKKGQYEKALPFANAAAGSGAGWAMTVAAECERGLGHEEAARAWEQQRRERYGQ